MFPGEPLNNRSTCSDKVICNWLSRHKPKFIISSCYKWIHWQG